MPRSRPRYCEWLASSHDAKHAPPARLVKKMENYVEDEADAVNGAVLQVLGGRFFERPVGEQRSSDHVLPRHQAPVTAVLAYITIVAHHEVAVWRHHQILTCDVRTRCQPPLRGDVAVIVGRNRGKIIPIGIVAAVAEYVGFVQGLAVPVNNSIAQVDTVAWHAHNPLDHVETGFGGMQKYHNIAVLRIVVRQEVA